MSSDITINVSSNMVNGQIYFYTSFSRKLTEDESANLASVNLSRGGTRMFRLDRLADHNGTGANWSRRNDGLHSEKQQFQYTERVRKDIASAWESSKAAIAKAAAAKKAAAEQAALNTSVQPFFVANGN